MHKIICPYHRPPLNKHWIALRIKTHYGAMRKTYCCVALRTIVRQPTQ